MTLLYQYFFWVKVIPVGFAETLRLCRAIAIAIASSTFFQGKQNKIILMK